MGDQPKPTVEYVAKAKMKYEKIAMLKPQQSAGGLPPFRAGVLRPLGLSITGLEPLTGAASLLGPRRQPRGGVGS
jgi:hypothetical protein